MKLGCELTKKGFDPMNRFVVFYFILDARAGFLSQCPAQKPQGFCRSLFLFALSFDNPSTSSGDSSGTGSQKRANKDFVFEPALQTISGSTVLYVPLIFLFRQYIFLLYWRVVL